jgi:ubiquinone/menaquinone biosynthesis C-methylase UbiE
MTDQEIPRPKARKTVHQAILKWFSNQQRGTVLDVPAGYGHLSMNLQKMGFTPVCAEIQPEIIQVQDVKKIFTDLDHSIDAPDSSFDYVACIEGLEHTTNPYQAVSEIARVLKPGGIAIFSLPNYTSIERRIRFLLTGSLLLPISDETLKLCNGHLFELHNSPLTITLVEFILRKNKLLIKEIRSDKRKKHLNLLLPYLWLIRKGIEKYFGELFKKYHLALTLNGDVFLGGNCVIIITQKSS